MKTVRDWAHEVLDLLDRRCREPVGPEHTGHSAACNDLCRKLVEVCSEMTARGPAGDGFQMIVGADPPVHRVRDGMVTVCGIKLGDREETTLYNAIDGDGVTCATCNGELLQ